MQTAAEDRTLIQQAVRGNARAFELLMRRHEGRMYSLASRMCGNREDAQDCVQDAMLRIYRALSRFKGESSFSTWVYRITMNACLDELRRRRQHAGVSLDFLLENGWTPTDEINSPEESALNAERRQAICDAILCLPEDMRATIILREIHGLSYDEIAQVLSANVGTVKSRISRARERLRSMLTAPNNDFERNAV